MLPAQLTAESFGRYPQKGRDLAVANVAVLRELPLSLAVAILREVAQFDWLFPAEQREITGQFSALAALSDQKRSEVLSGFAALTVPHSLSDIDWVNEPKRFLESLTAHLWASHQIDAFHAAATRYAEAVKLGAQDAALPVPRTCLVVVPSELDKPGYPLFRKLRPQGVWFENISGDLTTAKLQEWMAARCAKHSATLAHFYIDGGEPIAIENDLLQLISWHAATPARQALLERMHRMINTPGSGPEMARTQMAGLSPADLGLMGTGKSAVMDHFAVSVLTEGSGTQIFSTTFAQWAARELLRRAQPATLLVRFGARQQLQPMNQMLAGTAPSSAPDIPGSLVDADMGAYYTWINQQRLPGAASSVFVAYSEARRQAVAVGPGLPRGTTSTETYPIVRLIETLT